MQLNWARLRGNLPLFWPVQDGVKADLLGLNVRFENYKFILFNSI